MASTISKPKSVLIVHTTLNLSGTSIVSHSGVAKFITATIPSGYKIVNHVDCWTTGYIGLVTSFDNYRTDNTASVYINNTEDYDITINTNGVLHLLTLCESI